jgi:hypothetical protein
VPYKHSEAFCVMTYRSDDGTESEQLWNSRDGVTPFVISLRSGKQATHVDWQADIRMPEDWKPPFDMRYFADLTPERAVIIAKANVARWLTDRDMAETLNRHYGSVPNAIESLSLQYLEVPGAPDVIDPLETNADSNSV